MILETHEFWQPDLRLEIVNGDDIMLTYKNQRYVASCQSIRNRWKATKAFSYIQGMSLIRVMRGKDCMLRCALWTTTQRSKFLGPVYTQHNYNGIESIPGIQQEFNRIKHKFGRDMDYDRNHYVLCDLSEYNGPWPTLDNFNYMDEDFKRLSSKVTNKSCYELCDYEGGELQYC